ncbi:MAG: hypothetical protein M3N43_12230 [Actinomycetota bacterium]|nr:hypothetical protein [Actinomycetota bacterium]
MDCCHKDDNPANDVLPNLRWDTKSANQADSVRNRTHHQGSKTACKRKHALDGANVVPVKNGRACRACRDTHKWAIGRGISSSDPRWIAEAAARFSEIMAGAGRYSGEVQTVCLRGHKLVKPNLIPHANPNIRDCRACSNTRAWAYNHGGTPASDPRWQVEADRRYALIMNRGQATRGANRRECSREHALVEPNLRPGAKRCLACARTQSWAYPLGISPTDPRYRAEADRRYAAIMAA